MGSILAVPANTNIRLDGKTALITGANAGIGKVTAMDFYKRGARVLLACRDDEKCKASIKDIKQQCNGLEHLGELVVIKLDLSSLNSVRACAAKLLQNEPKINILVNNAGIIGIPYTKSEDDFEMTFVTNHLGHFLLTLLLMPKLIQSIPVRIVTVSSMMHLLTSSLDIGDLNYERRNYSPSKAYIQSKLCNVLFTKELNAQLKENHIEGINVYVLHPGSIYTDIHKNMDNVTQKIWKVIATVFYKTPEEGAQTSIYCSVSEKCANESGLYYSECESVRPSKLAENKELAEKLWRTSWKMVGLEDNYNPFKTVN